MVEVWGSLHFECDYWVTSINDISNKNHNNLTICPNPFQTTATIKLENYKNENLTLKIYNVYGQTLRTMKIKQNETTLEKNNLTTGIYLYQLTDKEKIIGQGKFIIE